MAIKANGITIYQMTTEALREALEQTSNKRLIQLIERELNQRQALGVNRPARIEDWLG